MRPHPIRVRYRKVCREFVGIIKRQSRRAVSIDSVHDISIFDRMIAKFVDWLRRQAQLKS